jgi:hypothetical protein
VGMSASSQGSGENSGVDQRERAEAMGDAAAGQARTSGQAARNAATGQIDQARSTSRQTVEAGVATGRATQGEAESRARSGLNGISERAGDAKSRLNSSSRSEVGVGINQGMGTSISGGARSEFRSNMGATIRTPAGNGGLL